MNYNDSNLLSLIIYKKKSHIYDLKMASTAGQRYQDKVVIVTGGSQGIGLGIVTVFGMSVFFLTIILR